MEKIWTRYENLWCNWMHMGAMWPIHGSYRCRECLRVREVPWANDHKELSSSRLPS